MNECLAGSWDSFHYNFQARDKQDMQRQYYKKGRSNISEVLVTRASFDYWGGGGGDDTSQESLINTCVYIYRERERLSGQNHYVELALQFHLKT